MTTTSIALSQNSCPTPNTSVYCKSVIIDTSIVGSHQYDLEVFADGTASKTKTITITLVVCDDVITISTGLNIDFTYPKTMTGSNTIERVVIPLT